MWSRSHCVRFSEIERSVEESKAISQQCIFTHGPKEDLTHWKRNSTLTLPKKTVMIIVDSKELVA